jgi:hypothetical protein
VWAWLVIFAGAIALISVIPELMQERVLGWNSEVRRTDKLFQPVAMAEFRIPASPEAVVVGRSCENRQNQSVEGNRIIRLPDEFVWLCLGGSIAGMLLGVCYLWALGMFSGEQKRRY